MDALMRFPNAVEREPAIDEWLDDRAPNLGAIARHWFDYMRSRGDDVRELMHDGYPTACVADVAFAYVGVFKAHVNVGFFFGSQLDDPKRLLEGTGKRMRHVKLRPEATVEEDALRALIDQSYRDARQRLQTIG